RPSKHPYRSSRYSACDEDTRELSVTLYSACNRAYSVGADSLVGDHMLASNTCLPATASLNLTAHPSNPCTFLFFVGVILIARRKNSDATELSTGTDAEKPETSTLRAAVVRRYSCLPFACRFASPRPPNCIRHHQSGKHGTLFYDEFLRATKECPVKWRAGAGWTEQLRKIGLPKEAIIPPKS